MSRAPFGGSAVSSQLPAPLDRSFNLAVRSIASRLFPEGFDVTMDKGAAPATLAELNQHIEKTGRMLVWGGCSDRTIFACEDTNHAFRAWHDWTHWYIQAEMDLVGERRVADEQKQTLRIRYGAKPVWFTLIDVEVCGQAAYRDVFGEFPMDQMAFAQGCLSECGVAA